MKQRIVTLKVYSKQELAKAFDVHHCWITRKLQALYEHDYDRRVVPHEVAWELYLTYLHQRQLLKIEGRQRVTTKDLHGFLNSLDKLPDPQKAKRSYAEAMGGSRQHFDQMMADIELNRKKKLPGHTIDIAAQLI
ncbi:hypothetical protein SPB21_07620 [Leptothoe sp. ISB3NOV94-8A]